jgi:glyceraldehyde 3-phosphate dehydrogenase
MLSMNQLIVGLNGFGRIGRAFTRIAHNNPTIKIAAINTAKSSPDILSYLLKHDSVYREAPFTISSTENSIVIDGQTIATSNQKDPALIPWDQYGVNVVIDCTGAFKTREDLKKHLRGSVKKVIMTAPSKDETIPHVVLGANDDTFDFSGADIISNASCTTNCAAIMARVLDDHFKITAAFLTTVHAYTSSQELLDDASKNETRSRAAPLSIIPTTPRTGTT